MRSLLQVFHCAYIRRAAAAAAAARVSSLALSPTHNERAQRCNDPPQRAGVFEARRVEKQRVTSVMTSITLRALTRRPHASPTRVAHASPTRRPHASPTRHHPHGAVTCTSSPNVDAHVTSPVRRPHIAALMRRVAGAVLPPLVLLDVCFVCPTRFGDDLGASNAPIPSFIPEAQTSVT